jgi:prephenate dehydrogenase
LGSTVERVAIIGLGLIGGSFGLALRKYRGNAVEVVGFSRRGETIQRARQLGAIDAAATDLENAVAGAGVVVVATPVMGMRDILRKASGHLASGCTVTDIGSTKARVMQWADEYLPGGVDFVGGHPMAGKETSGIEEADADLFRGCVYCLTPSARAGEEAIRHLSDLVESVGATPLVIDAGLHDSLVAGISHLPILVSAAFVGATAKSPQWADMARLAASGYRDMSRLASGDPEVNRDICVTNRDEILAWLDRYMEELREFRSLLEEGDERLLDALARARATRQEWLRGQSR